jgi:hypothetical protein
VLTRHRAVLIAAVLAAATGFARKPAHTSDVIVHEWGTFTSVAGADGRAVAWFPLDGPVDLPCFVRRSYQVSSKGAMFASVRMETPVLYFYASEDVTLDVRIGFRQGLITEHFPPARVTPEKVAPGEMIEPGLDSSINWRDVRILPGAAPEFLTENSPNHYYAARATDAAPIDVAGNRERFLFYRGVGNFDLPIAATVVQGDDIVVTGRAVPAMMLFENRGGRMGYRLHTSQSSSAPLSRAEPNDWDGGIDAGRRGALPTRGERDDRDLARFVVYRRVAALLLGASGNHQCRPAAPHRSGAGSRRARVRRTSRACNRRDPRGYQGCRTLG